METKNFLTINVECWFHAEGFKTKISPSEWHLQTTLIVENVQQLIALLKKHNVSATFFILGWVVDNYPEIVALIDSSGHELATYGYYPQSLREMTPSAFEEDLAKTLNAFAKYSNQRISGHRAYQFSITKDTLWALEILAKYGITYDASIFPGPRQKHGISHYPNLLPHEVLLPQGLTITEIPFSKWKMGKANAPLVQAGNLQCYSLALTEKFISQQSQLDLPGQIYLSTWERKNSQTLFSKLFNKIVMPPQRQSTLSKLEYLLTHFSFAGVKENLSSDFIQSLLRRNPVTLLSNAIADPISEKQDFPISNKAFSRLPYLQNV